MAMSSEWNTAALCRNAKCARPFCYKMGQIPPPLLHLHPHLHPSISAWIFFSETQEPFSLLWIRRYGATNASVAATRQLKDMVCILSVMYRHSDLDGSLQCIDTSKSAATIQICDTTTGFESLES